MGEILQQLLVEYLFEIGFHSFGNTIKTPKNPVWATIGFGLWGCIAGLMSLLIFPKSMIVKHDLRVVGLIAIPVIAGFFMTLIGKIRRLKGQDLIRMDRFFYAFTFALTMSLMRFHFAA